MTKATPHARSDLTAASSSGIDLAARAAEGAVGRDEHGAAAVLRKLRRRVFGDTNAALRKFRADGFPLGERRTRKRARKGAGEGGFSASLGADDGDFALSARRMPSNNSFDIKKQPPYTNVPGIRKPFVSPRIRLLQFSI